jgi:serine phosphatase RsbU (regulator of sigma subunit)
MSVVQLFFNRLINFGVDDSLPHLIIRQIKLSNQIILISLLFSVVYLFINTFLIFNWEEIISIIIFSAVFLLVLALNGLKYHLAGRTLLAVSFPTIIIITTIFSKASKSADLQLMQHFGDKAMILALITFPIMLLDHRREKIGFWVSFGYVFLSLIFYENIVNFFSKIPNNQWISIKEGYEFIHFAFMIGAIGTPWVIFFLKNLNYQFEKKLLAQNEEMKIQQEEILTQNEELHQQQEEILTQRDFIEQKNRELETFNQKLQTSENQIKQQNRTLSEQNRQMNSSLSAAQTIQKAIMPYQEKLDSLLKDYFVIYQPKDVVSGDFFWLNKIEQQTILITADCTGHGVPGAFMTLIGNTLLDKIIRVWQITQPAQILNRLHEEIGIVLRQAETGNNNGMDIAVICIENIDAQNFKVSYSGAKLPLYYIAKAEEEIQQLNATRKGIGGVQNETVLFENHIVNLPKGSLIYMGSDGYIDQNNEKRKRLGEKRFKQILSESKHLPLAQQKQKLEDELAIQMKNTAQRDDILVVGFKL